MGLLLPSLVVSEAATGVFCTKSFSQKFRKIRRKTPVPGSLFNKVTGVRPATLLKKGIWHMSFLVNFEKFLRTLSTEHLQDITSVVYQKTSPLNSNCWKFKLEILSQHFQYKRILSQNFFYPKQVYKSCNKLIRHFEKIYCVAINELQANQLFSSNRQWDFPCKAIIRKFLKYIESMFELVGPCYIDVLHFVVTSNLTLRKILNFTTI